LTGDGTESDSLFACMTIIGRDGFCVDGVRKEYMRWVDVVFTNQRAARERKRE
jgi:hypothetical protein